MGRPMGTPPRGRGAIMGEAMASGLPPMMMVVLPRMGADAMPGLQQ